MKTNRELCEELSNAGNALNTIQTSGMQNLLNLGGAINLINEIIKELYNKPEPTEQEK